MAKTKPEPSTDVQPGPEPNSVTIQNVAVTAPTKTAWFKPGSPTPEWASALFNYFFWATATVGLVITFLNNDISLNTKYEILKWIGVANVVVRSFCKQFGIVVDTDKTKDS